MRRNDTSEASIGQGTQNDRPRSTFSRKSFLTHIINFVVVDDQASFNNILETYHIYLLGGQSINVIECREFRDLLLLMREDLQDKDIPRRTKLCEAIIKSWQAWFHTLKQNLAVLCSTILTQSSYLRLKLFIGCHWPN